MKEVTARLPAQTATGASRPRRAVFYSPASTVGGAERYLSLVLPALARTWEVTLFCPAARELDSWVAELRSHGIHVVRADQGRRMQRAAQLMQLARYCRKADLLHINLIKPPVCLLIGLIGRLTQVPRRAGTEHLVLLPREMTRYRIKHPYLRLLAGFHRHTLHWVLCPSRYSRSVLISEYGFPASKVHLISHGVELERPSCNLAPRPRRRQEASGTPWPVLGCVGWVQERKGQFLIVEAMPALRAQFPDIRAIFVGAGPDIAPLTERAHALGVEHHVCFTGHRDDVDTLFRQMDVFILPSRVEGLPIAPIEAMAHRLPVIANDIPPLREVVGDTGIFLRNRSPEAVVEAVRELFAMEDPQALGAAARARAEREFWLQRMIDDTLRRFDGTC